MNCMLWSLSKKRHQLRTIRPETLINSIPPTQRLPTTSEIPKEDTAIKEDLTQTKEDQCKDREDSTGPDTTEAHLPVCKRLQVQACFPATMKGTPKEDSSEMTMMWEGHSDKRTTQRDNLAEAISASQAAAIITPTTLKGRDLWETTASQMEWTTPKAGDSLTLDHQEAATEVMDTQRVLNQSNPKLNHQTWTTMHLFMRKRTELTTTNKSTHFNELFPDFTVRLLLCDVHLNVSYNHNFI